MASLEHLYPVKDLLAFVGLPTSTYYWHRSRPPRVDRHAAVRPIVRDEFARSYRAYGYRRLKLVLKNKHGISMSGKTVAKIMRQENCRCQIRRRKYRSYRGEIGRIAPNVIARDFAAGAPNQKWVTDITEFTIAGTKLYMSPLIDLFNGEVLSYSLGAAPVLELVMSMLRPALTGLEAAAAPLIHSDQGWHYQHRAYRQLLAAHGVEQSMSRRGNCLDNAVAENFFSHLKEEFIRPHRFDSVEQFRRDLEIYIHWFNHDRIRERLGGRSPVQFREARAAA